LQPVPPEGETDEDTPDEDEEDPAEGNQAVIKYLDRSLRKLRLVFTQLHNRHIVLYTALRNNWSMAETVERHLEIGDSKTVFEKILKEEEEERKRKRDASPERQTKRRRDGGKAEGGRGGQKHAGGPSWDVFTQMSQAVAAAAVAATQAGGRGRQQYNPAYGRPYNPPFNPSYGQGGFNTHLGGRGGYGPGGQPPRRQGPDTRECFNCRQPGHSYKQCYNPPARQ
jgi:hypothetical protein